MKTLRRAFAALLFSFAGWAGAFTPESGLWWDPLEDGRGYTIEIQDNVMAVLLYGYDTNGTSAFFIGANVIGGNSTFSATLDGFTAGQCNTCSYAGRPITLNGAGGSMSIVFTSETRALLNLNGRIIPIQRFNFAHGNTLQQMLGEWQITLDFSPLVAANAHPFFGDVIKLDRISSTAANTYLGCRPDDASYARCTAFDYANHDAAGGFVSSTGSHAIVVKDAVNAQGQSVFLLYNVQSGLSQFDGQARFSENGVLSPIVTVRGFRSASRLFVQTGNGPSTADPKAASATGPSSGVFARAREVMVPSASLSGPGTANADVHPDVEAEWRRLMDVLE